MRVVLGAWGIGAFIAANSRLWSLRFGNDPSFKGTLPPMSSIIPGMVEPFPLVLASKVFIDADQYEFLTAGGDRFSWRLHDGLPQILREFERNGVLAPVSYRSLLQQKMQALVGTAEKILTSEDLPAAASESRRLWSHFLRSSGAAVLPHVDKELRIVEHSDETEGKKLMWSPTLPHLIAAADGKTYVTKAALGCGHDVFDVVALLSLARDLDATVGDWHMYDPFYSLAIRVGRFPFVSDDGAGIDERNLRCYIPIPSEMRIDDIWRLREDPYVAALRDGKVTEVIRGFGDFEAPEAWRQLRRTIQSKVTGVVFNPYNARTSDNENSILSEAIALGVSERKPSWQSPALAGSRELQRILFLAAEPTDSCRLRLGQEYRDIRQTLSKASADRLSLSQEFAVRPADLSWAVLSFEPTIIHFSGHGSLQGHLCLEDDSGKTHAVEPEALADLFKHFANHLQLVVLNACFSAKQAAAIGRYVPFVVGMQQNISDRAAISYSIGLYQAIGVGRSIKDSHALGCAQIRLQGLNEHTTPQLICR